MKPCKNCGHLKSKHNAECQMTIITIDYLKDYTGSHLERCSCKRYVYVPKNQAIL